MYQPPSEEQAPNEKRRRMNRLGRITADDLLKTTVEGLLRTTPKGDRMESTLVTSSLARHIGERPERVQSHVLAGIQEELEEHGLYHGPVTRDTPMGPRWKQFPDFKRLWGWPPTGKTG